MDSFQVSRQTFYGLYEYHTLSVRFVQLLLFAIQRARTVSNRVVTFVFLFLQEFTPDLPAKNVSAEWVLAISYQ